MTLATQTLKVIGIRSKDEDFVTLELGPVQAGPLATAFATRTVEVAAAGAPPLGTAVTLTFTVQT